MFDIKVKIDRRVETDGVESWFFYGEDGRLRAFASADTQELPGEQRLAVTVDVASGPLPRAPGQGVEVTPEMHARQQATAFVRRAKYMIELQGYEAYKRAMSAQEGMS